jgi:tetratricopeptide (TPR) repeat protein
MDEATRKQVKITCPVCKQHLDVTELPAFEIVACVSCGEKLLVPMQLGNYRLLSTIGGGGMGMVYRAVDMSLGRAVAVKLLRKDLSDNKSFVDTFLREARAVASLSHPNIATLYSFGVEDDQYYLVMELVSNGSLDDMITRRSRVPEAEALDFIIQVASGLRHAYQRGLIHRDIKPGNILFNQAGIPKLVDFGLAEFHTEARKAEQPGIWGTPYYIAPEKVAGEKEDFRSDIYSLGGTMFHALAGRAPFEANTATDVVLKHLSTPALSLKTFAPDVSDETCRVVGRMLLKNRMARYNSYDALLRDLHLARQHLATKGVHRVSADVQKQVRRSMIKAVALIAAVVVAIGVCGYFLWTQREQIFGAREEPPPLPAANVASPTGAPPAPGVREPPPPAWRTPWTSAISSLNQGNYAGAASQYQEALKRQDELEPMRPWAQAQIGLAYLLAFKTNEAAAAYEALAPSNTPAPRITSDINSQQLATLIAMVMTDQTPMKDLLAKVDELPEWGQALTRLHLAVKSLAREEFTFGQKLFYDYSATIPPEERMWNWVKSFEMRANVLGLECENYNRDMPVVLEARKQGEYDTALARLQSLRNSVTYPTLVAKVTGLQTAIKQEVAAIAEQRKRAEEERQRALLEKDKELIARIDATVPAYAAAYVFAPVAGAYRNALQQMQTEAGKQDAQQRLDRYQALADLKTFAIAQISQKPWKGGAVSVRTGGEVKGALYKADEDKLYFQIAYGEIPQLWRNLLPGEVARIFQVCLAAAEGEQKEKLEAALGLFREELKLN